MFGLKPIVIAQHERSLCLKDLSIEKILEPGSHAYWKFNRRVASEQIDLRLQAMEVSGQEILTKNKVTLRVNMSAQYPVLDPVKARMELTNYTE